MYLIYNLYIYIYVDKLHGKSASHPNIIDARKEISINLAGLSQQNQINLLEYLVFYFILNCTIKDNFVLCAISKNIMALLKFDRTT